MSSDRVSSSQIDTNTNNSSNNVNHNISDVLLYAESKITRKQAVREIADIVLRANMKPKTVKHALQLLRAVLPPENTLPATVDELFGAMLSSENDWRLAQYLIRHKQCPSFLSTLPNIWSDNSNSHSSLTAASSSSIPRNQDFNTSAQSSFFLPVETSSSSSSSSESSSSLSSSSESSDDDNDDDDDDNPNDEGNVLYARLEAQQQRITNSSLVQSVSTETTNLGNNIHSVISTNINNSNNNNHDTSDQRSQIVSSSINRVPLLGSFKRSRSESSSEESDSEPDLFYTTRLLDDDDDDEEEDDDDDDDDEGDNNNEPSFFSMSNNNNNNNKFCCFEMNGCDLLDGGKRRRH